jgi:hypothetical protein
MIPQRMLSNEICGNGLKDRVTACRKRLRVNRTRHKPLAHDEDADLFPETAALFPFEGSDPREGEALLSGRQHEVGIT